MEQPEPVQAQGPEGAAHADAAPLAVEKSKKKKKKMKYSRGLRDLQTVGRRLTKVSERLARANAAGIETYRKASDKSARKKRDGAMRDFGVNAAKGMSKSLRKSSRVPVDIARALSPRGTRKRTRRQLKVSARLARAMRIR